MTLCENKWEEIYTCIHSRYANGKKIRPVAKLQLGGFRMEQHFPQCNNNANVTTVAFPMMSIPMV